MAVGSTKPAASGGAPVPPTVERPVASEPKQPVASQPATSKPKQQVPWSGFVGIVYAAVVYFAAQIFAGLLVSAYLQISGREAAINAWLSSSNVVIQFWYILVAEALTFGAIVWFIRWRKGSLRAIGWREVHWKDVGYALVAIIAYYLLYIVVLSAVTRLVPSVNTEQSQDLGFDDVYGTVPLLLTFISLVVLPPLVEELVFRGFVFSGLKNKLPVVVAAVITSLLFASAHLQFGNGKPLLWVAAIDTFTLSMVLCYLRQKTGGLWAGIFVHAMKNGIAFISLFLIHLS